MLKAVEFDRVDRGMFDSVEPGDVPSGGWAFISNFLPFNRRMNRRSGSAPFTLDTKGMTGDLSTVIPVSDFAVASEPYDEWALVAISRIGEVELSNGAGSWEGTVHPTGAIATVTEDEMPWRCIVRNNRVYAVRRAGGIMRRIDGDEWRQAGRPAPTSEPTLASSATATSLAAGTYLVAYAYRDSRTGYTGAYSETESITISAGDQIDVSDLIAPTTAFFADRIVLAMTRVDGGTLLENSEIAVSTTATISSDSFGEAISLQNDQPSANATWLEHWGERMWWPEGSTLHYSPIGEFESYGAGALNFEKGSGSNISVVYGWADRLVVAKRRKVFLMAGFDRSTWETKEWSQKLGCVAPHSMRDCEGRLLFKSEDGFAMSKDGEPPMIITDDTVKAALEEIDTSREDLTFAEVFPKLKLYLAVFPKMDGSWGGLAYNWQSDAWAPFNLPAQPRSLRLSYDSTGKTRLFAVMNSSNQAYAILEGNTDDGSPISGILRSGAPKLTEQSGFLASIHSIALLCAKTRWPVTFRIYGDGAEEPMVEVETNLEGDLSWKRVAIDNIDDPRLQLQVEIEYEGKDPFWIAEWMWTVNATKKHLEEF